MSHERVPGWRPPRRASKKLAARDPMPARGEPRRPSSGPALPLSWASLRARLADGGSRVLTRDSAGGRLARRLVPASIGVPLGLAVLCRLGETHGVVSPHVGLSVMIVATIVMLSGLALRTARRLDIDDTARRIAEDELRTDRDRSAAFINAQHDGVGVVSSAGVLIEVNPAFCRLTGYSREELIGLSEPFPFIPESDHQADVGAHLGRVRRGEVGGESDIVLLRKDGVLVPVIASSALVHDVNGRVTARISTVKDMSERRKAEELRRKNEERFAALLESGPDSVVIADSAGCIRLVNTETERMFGYSREELLGRPVEMLLPETAQTVHIAHRTEYLADARTRSMGGGGDVNLAGRRKNGNVFPVDVSLSTLDTDEGRLLTAFVRDITAVRKQQVEREGMVAELSRRADDLARSNAELEQFAYIASHDLAEPLRSISGFTQLLARRYQGQIDEDADRFIGFVVDGVNRMQMLIADLLTYSRAGRAELQVRSIPLGDVVARLRGNLAPAIEDTGAEITVGALPTVDADETLLGQLLQNLVSNALKFHSPGCAPRVEIGAVESEGGWRISVADNGLGIDPAYSDRIFKMFQRLQARDDYPGTGIGLAVCQRLVERHGGRIWFEPNTPRGTIFNFTLRAAGPARDADRGAHQSEDIAA